MAERNLARIAGADWSHPEFALIARALHETAGLVFPANRRESAEAGIRRAMAAACISDPRDFRHAMSEPGETRDGLITELTIGETFFFREPGQFEFLRTTALPELRLRLGQRRLRAWSAGCATGEEPYSFAMLLRDVAWQGEASILGTDLASARLAAARRARYTAWSMRGVDPAVIARFFERRGKQFVLRSDIRRSVEFRVLNLASSDYPSSASGVEQMDFVFCRNVLIYFDLATVAAIARRLLASLAPGGWLFLGASDPSIAELVPCEVVMTGAGLAYRPAGTSSGVRPTFVAADPDAWFRELQADFDEGPDVAALDVEALDAALPWTGTALDAAFPAAAPPSDAEGVAPDDSPDPIDTHESAYDQGDYDAAGRLAADALARGDHTERTWVVLVRSLANRGQLAAAGEACATALDEHRLSAELTHLHGILLAEAGRHTEAAIAARRALYLDPHYTIAHLALGDALARTGDASHARRAFGNAERQLRSLPPDALVPGADGATASQLLSIARFRLGVLHGVAEVRHT